MMTNSQLATASLNDIVFDGRNKRYGAYELRAIYQRHVTRALAIAVAICALLLVFPIVAQMLKDKTPAFTKRVYIAPTIVDVPINPPAAITPPLPAAKPPVQPPQQPTVKNLVPVVVEDKKAPGESEVPEQITLLTTQSGVRTVAGDPNAEPSVPADLPVGTGSSATTGSVPNKPFTFVEQMPELPGGGGQLAIVAAIQKAVHYPSLALRNQVEGRVFVSFTVDSKGEITDVKIVKGLGSGLDEETMRAIKTLPRFIPGKQNGQEVSVSFTVPITFKIQ